MGGDLGAVFALCPRGQGDSVPGPVRDAEVTVLTAWHSFEQIRGRPVDKLHEKAVAERPDDVEREFVHDMRREGQLVGGGEMADPKRLAEAVGAADVGHEKAGCPPLDEIAELEARLMVLAGGDRDADRAGDLGAGSDIVGEHRLLEPNEIEVLEERRLAYCPKYVEPLIDVHHETDAVAQGLAYGLDALTIYARVGMVDFHFVVATTQGDIAPGLGDEVVY